MLTLNICKIQRAKAVEEIARRLTYLYTQTSNFDKLDGMLTSWINNRGLASGLKEKDYKQLNDLRAELVSRKRFLGFDEQLRYENLNHASEVMKFFNKIENLRCSYDTKEQNNEFNRILPGIQNEIDRAYSDKEIEGFEHRLLLDIIRAARNDRR